MLASYLGAPDIIGEARKRLTKKGEDAMTDMDRWANGFRVKCAEHGLDEDATVAAMAYAMQKRGVNFDPAGMNSAGAKIGDLVVGGGRANGTTAAGILSPSGGVAAGVKDNVIGNAALGALAGAGVGAGLEALRGDDRKQYLKRMLRTALFGAAAAGLGTMASSAPNYLAKARDAVAGGLGRAKKAVE